MATFFRGQGERHGKPTRGAIPRSDQEVRQFLRLLPRYRLLLYAGPDLAIGHAIEALLATVPALTEDEAVEVVAQAQALGAGQVAVCLRELAEFYCEGLSRQGVQCAIELV